MTSFPLSAASAVVTTEGDFVLAASEAVRAAGVGLDSVDAAAVALAHVADRARQLGLPGAGETVVRWAALAAVASVDVTLGRLFEAHADALAILAELDGPPPEPGQRWAVWAAEGPQATVRAAPDGASWCLDGDKPWCSGAVGCTHALVTADGPEGRALYAVELGDRVRADTASWGATALTGTATYTVTFSGAPAERVGEPGAYLSRPGFWHGGAGVAAAWWGGARGVADALYARAAGSTDPHLLAHLGAVDVALAGSAALLVETAAAIDCELVSEPELRERAALRMRAAAEQTAATVIRHTGRALGPAPLSHDRAHARRVADLELYVRQSHAERDLARIGALAGGVG